MEEKGGGFVSLSGAGKRARAVPADIDIRIVAKGRVERRISGADCATPFRKDCPSVLETVR